MAIQQIQSNSAVLAAPLSRPQVQQAPVPVQARLAPSDTLALSARGKVPASAISFAAPAFDPIEAGKKNTTQGLSKAHMPMPVKEALGPTLKIIRAVDPEMAKAIDKLDEDDFILADNGLKDLFGQHDMYAAWVAVVREGGTANLHFSDMVLDDRFWKLRDAEKASVLMHEMVHSKDIPIVSHFEKLFGTIKNKVQGVEWGDPVEDRAYVHQYQMFEKLGIGSSDEIFWTAQTYLEDRGLVEPYKF